MSLDSGGFQPAASDPGFSPFIHPTRMRRVESHKSHRVPSYCFESQLAPSLATVNRPSTGELAAAGASLFAGTICHPKADAKIKLHL